MKDQDERLVVGRRLTEAVRGRLYCLRGGHFMRCTGGGKSVFFFTDATFDLRLVDDRFGYAVHIEDVLYELTSAHLPILLFRVKEKRARKLDCADELLMIEELKSRYYDYARSLRVAMRIQKLEPTQQG